MERKALTSTERYRKRRKSIYNHKIKHNNLKEKERIGMSAGNRAKAFQRECDTTLMEKYREQQREKKRKQRAKKEKKVNMNFSSPQRKDIKHIIRWVRRRKEAEIKKTRLELAVEGSCSSQRESRKRKRNEDDVDFDVESGTPVLVSKALWKHTSPSLRKKVKRRIQNEETPKGFKYQMRKELGIIYIWNEIILGDYPRWTKGRKDGRVEGRKNRRT